MPRSLMLLLLMFVVPLTARADITLPVTSPAARFSPATWAGDAGRGGSISRRTWNNGAWCSWRWSTTSPHPTATLQVTNQTPGSAVSYFLDGALTDNVPVPASGGISIAGLTAPGPHTLTVYTRNSQQTARWRGANAYTVTGLTLDHGATLTPAPPLRPWVLIVGDSITEGIQANDGADDSLRDYSFLVGQGLNAAGYDYAVSACGYSGWVRPGDAQGDVPAYFPVPDGAGRWDRIDANTSLLDARRHLSAYGQPGQEPSAILFNYGVNECLSRTDTATMRQSVILALTVLRRAASAAQIIVLVPPGLADTRIYPNGPAYINALQAAVTTYRATHPTDRKIVLVDLGPDAAHAIGSPAYGGGVHPHAAGHAYLAPLVLQALLTLLSALIPSVRRRRPPSVCPCIPCPRRDTITPMRTHAPSLLLAALLAAFSLTAPAARAADAPKTVLHMDFAADDPARVLSPADTAAVILTTDPAEEVGGRKSLKGDSRAAAIEWNEFFHSKTGLLAPKEAYTASFDYRILARAANAKFYVLARRAGSTAGSAGWKEWAGEAGGTGHVETTFTTSSADDILIIGIQNKGALAINNLILTTVPALRPPGLPAPARTWKSPGGTAYYVDSVRGSDADTGRDTRHAWRSLGRVNAGVFGPGDRILLHAGSRWAGFLSPGGSGAEGRPITVSRYGSGPKPAVDAAGKALATVYLFNGEYWDVSNLDIANRAPARVPGLTGVEVRLENFGVARGIRLHGLDIHDVFGSNVKDAGGGNGISCASGGDKGKTRYDGLTIEDCRLARTDRNGITMSAYYPRPSWPLSTHVVIRGNTLTDIGGDGIVPIGCDGCLIEHNILRGGRMRAQDYAAGIWPWSCDNTVVQFNEVSGMKGTMDGEGYDSDYNCRHTLFQYNSSHDNDGGFMLICDDGSQSPPWNIGNAGTVIRYNISLNDGQHTFNITGPCQDTQIYNNTFYLGKGRDIPLVASGNWGGKWPADTRFFNNVFYVEGKARFDLGGMTQVAFDSNAYWGAIANRPADAHAVLADPLLTVPLHRAGRVIPNNGGRDFWENPLPASGPPDIGAYQATEEKTAPIARSRKAPAGGKVHAGMSGAGVRQILGRPNRITLVPVLNSRHFYQVWYYKSPGSASPHAVLELDEHDRVLSVRP